MRKKRGKGWTRVKGRNRKKSTAKLSKDPIAEKLKKLYYTPSQAGSFTSLNKIYKAAKELNNGGKIKRKTIKNWLSKEEIESLHKPVVTNFTRGKVFTKGLNDMLEIDLIDATKLSKANNGMKFILVVIDAFSRKLWMRAQPTKNAKDTLKSLASILEEIGKVKRIRGDSGREFINKLIEDKIQANGIKFINVTNEKSKAAFAERVIRTFKKKLYKYLHANQTEKYIDVLDDLVDSYNNTYHSTIRMKPNDVNKDNEFKLWMRLYLRSFLKTVGTPKYKVGDNVRITEYRNKFAKSHDIGWTQEYYKIAKIIYSLPMRYQLEDLKGEPITGSFYEAELQPVFKDKQSKFNIEEVLDERGTGKKKQYLVSWQGYGPQFNEWVNASDVNNL